MSFLDRLRWRLDTRIRIETDVHIENGTRIVPPYKLEFSPGTNHRRIMKNCGEVVIRRGTWIGANGTIQRGVIRPTTIGEYVWIDHSVNVAHDCIIGNRTCLVLGTSLGGEVEIGEDSFIGIGTMIKPRVKIGNRTLIGMGSVVIEDIPNGVIAYGNPCKVHRPNEWYPPNPSSYQVPLSIRE